MSVNLTEPLLSNQDPFTSKLSKRVLPPPPLSTANTSLTTIIALSSDGTSPVATPKPQTRGKSGEADGGPELVDSFPHETVVLSPTVPNGNNSVDPTDPTSATPGAPPFALEISVRAYVAIEEEEEQERRKCHRICACVLGVAIVTSFVAAKFMGF